MGADTYCHIVGVNMSGAQAFDEDDLAELTQLPSIKVVGLRGEYTTGEAMQYVARSPNLDTIELESFTLRV